MRGDHFKHGTIRSHGGCRIDQRISARLIDPMGVWGEKTFAGRKYMGIFRATFVVGADGRIEHVWEKVTPENHAEEVLAYLKGEAASAEAPQKPAAKK